MSLHMGTFGPLSWKQLILTNTSCYEVILIVNKATWNFWAEDFLLNILATYHNIFMSGSSFGKHSWFNGVWFLNFEKSRNLPFLSLHQGRAKRNRKVSLFSLQFGWWASLDSSSFFCLCCLTIATLICSIFTYSGCQVGSRVKKIGK